MLTPSIPGPPPQKHFFSLSDLLDFHHCFAVVLLKLEELFRPAPNANLIKWRVEAIEERFHLGGRGKTSAWAIWVKEIGSQKPGEEKEKKLPTLYKKFPTVYKMRDFYALDAPNNLAMRFQEMEEKKRNKGDSREPGKWRYDEYIKQWGEYARNMVCANGGWRAFLKQTAPANVIDFWPSSSFVAKSMKIEEADSFARRVLALYHDRYVQVLAAPVASLWPLWLLRESWIRNLLRDIQAIEGKKVRIGRPLPPQEDDLYIDVNIEVGKRKGLPFPFGFADECLPDGSRPPFWNQDTSTLIAAKLKDFHWAPPLLFGARSDRLNRPSTPGKTEVISYLTLSGQVPGYAAIYKRRTKAPRSDRKRRRIVKALSSVKVYAIPAGWGVAVIEKLQENFTDCRDNFKTREINLASKPNEIDADLVLSHFPADIFFQESDRFYRLPNWKYYGFFGKSGEPLNYVLPATILAGSSLLARQPKTRSLLVDFSAYLGKIELLFRWLTPDKKHLAEPLDKIRFAKGKAQRARRTAAARDLENQCRGIAERNPLLEAGLIERSFLPDTFRKVARNMANVMFQKDMEEQSRTVIENWAWAQMLEYVDRFFVYLAQDLFI
jgi:hypothetical protein